MTRHYLFFGVLISVLSTPAAAEIQLIEEPLDCAKSVYTFDSSKITEEALRRRLDFSPTRTYVWEAPSGLYHCPPDVKNCVEGTTRSRNFSEDLEKDLQPVRDKLAELQRAKLEKELRPVYGYYNSILSFWYWIHRTRGEFYKTWDANILRSKFGKLEPGIICGDIIAAIDRDSSKDDKFSMAMLNWHNCINSAFRKKLGSYPRQAWDDYLKANQIRWDYKKIDNCD